MHVFYRGPAAMRNSGSHTVATVAFAKRLAASVDGLAGDDFVLVEWTAEVGPHWIAPLHVHHADDEAWYVLEGELGFRLGDEEVIAGRRLRRRGSPRHAAHLLECGRGGGAVPPRDDAEDRAPDRVDPRSRRRHPGAVRGTRLRDSRGGADSPGSRPSVYEVCQAQGSRSQHDGRSHRPSGSGAYASSGSVVSSSTLAVAGGELRHRVQHLHVLRPRAGQQDHARPVAGSDEDVLRPRRTAEEVPLPRAAPCPRERVPRRQDEEPPHATGVVEARTSRRRPVPGLSRSLRAAPRAWSEATGLWVRRTPSRPSCRSGGRRRGAPGARAA